MSTFVSKAPGRVCLFGDHQDYLHLPVIACAIDRYITLTAKSIAGQTTTVQLPDIKDSFTIQFEKISTLGNWGKDLERYKHLLAAIKVVGRVGCYPSGGFDIRVDGSIPINAGLSSSSALVVAWTQFLLTAFGANQAITPELIGQLAYEAEVLEQESPGGKMDQYTSALGQMIFLETKKNGKITSFDRPLEGLIIAESGVAKNTIGLLHQVKSRTFAAVASIKQQQPDFDLASATMEAYNSLENMLDQSQRPYLYAALKNHEITQKALFALREKKYNYPLLGELMTSHHHILRDCLKTSIPKIDRMIAAAITAGAYGGKIVGSGGGGCVCVLSPPDKASDIITALTDAGATAAYAVNVSKGAAI